MHKLDFNPLRLRIWLKIRTLTFKAKCVFNGGKRALQSLHNPQKLNILLKKQTERVK